MRNLLILLVLCAGTSFAACSPTSTAGCAVLECAGATSAASALAGTSYGSVTGITQICGQSFETTPFALKYDCAWPTGSGATNLIGDYRWSGGWSSGSRASFMTTAYGLITMAQQLGSLGKSTTVCTHDYPFSGTAPWPAQAQADRQFLYFLANDAGATVPGNRQAIYELGDSASTQLGAIQLLTQGQTTPWTDTGGNTANTNYKIVGGAFMYNAFCIAAGCAYPATQFSSDQIQTVVIHAGGGGTGYLVGDLITPTLAGCAGTQFKVATVSGSVVATLSIVNFGTGCPPSLSAHSATATTGGTGMGLTLDITVGQNFNGTAFRKLLGCTTEWDLVCEAAADTANKASPILWMTAGNPNIHVPMQCGSGENDQVVPNNQLAPLLPPWGTPMDCAAAQSTLGALGVPIANIIYPGDHEQSMQPSGSGGTCSAGWFCAPMQDAVNFIVNGIGPVSYIP